MELWSKLCPTTLHAIGRETSHNHSIADSESYKSVASYRRSHYSNKQAQSLPATDAILKGPANDVTRQFSLSNLAMQNNCTVLNNKVAPVVIRNCKQEYQVRQTSAKLTGRLHDLSTEHELLLEKFFLLKDNFIGIDRHDSLQEHGVPNLRMTKHEPKLYAIGQPTMKGLKKFTTTLLAEHKFVYYVNVRAAPTLFLRRSDDFLPYSAYSKRNSEVYLTERQLHDAEREMQLQALEIASSNSGTFFYYNVLDASPDEPHMYSTGGLDDLVTSRQMYAKIQAEHKNFRYKRLVLPNVNEPSSEWLDALMDILKECSLSGNEDYAIVFQGLTGEGPACLAMMFTMLAVPGEMNLQHSHQEKTVGIVNVIQRSCAWREFIIRKLIDSSRLQGQDLRRQVDSVIACCATRSILASILREAKRITKQNNLNLELGIPLPFQNELEESISINKDNKSEQKTDKVKEIPEFGNLSLSLTLRDVSEMSLPNPKRKGENRSKDLCRYEVYDEECLLRKLLFNLNLYYFLLIFRMYVKELVSTGMQTFSQWLTLRPNLIFDLAQTSQYKDDSENANLYTLEAKTEEGYSVSTDPSFHRVVGMPFYGIAQSLPDRFAELVVRLCGPTSRKKYKRVVFVNVWDEMVFYSVEDTQSTETHRNGELEQNGVSRYSSTQYQLKSGATSCMHGASAELIEEVEIQLKNFMNKHPDEIQITGKGCSSLNVSLKTTQEVIDGLATDFLQVSSNCENTSYVRIPLAGCRIPKFKSFDRLIEMVRDTVDTNGETACVFFCKDGKKRTTNMMAAACLVYGHMKEFPEPLDGISSEIEPWAPDVEFTRGEFTVVLELLQILPDCYLRKREVDLVLDLCHESMSTMHYHLRENLNPSYKKAKRATSTDEFLKFKHRSFQSLEFYVFLILFNCYLKQEVSDHWRSLTFDDWMLQYASRLGVLELLNNFGFLSFGESYPLNLMQCRWMSTQTLIRHLFCDTTSSPAAPYLRSRVRSSDSELDKQSMCSSLANLTMESWKLENI